MLKSNLLSVLFTAVGMLVLMAIVSSWYIVVGITAVVVLFFASKTILIIKKVINE